MPTLVMLAFLAAVALTTTWAVAKGGRPAPDSPDDTEDGGDGGSKVPLAPQTPPSPSGDADPPWWPQFERDFAAYANRVKQA
jgi:hypothetical protein